MAAKGYSAPGFPRSPRPDGQPPRPGLRVPAKRVNDIVRGRRSITADTALRLSRYFVTTPQFWMNLQANYDLEVAQDAIGREIIQRIRPHRAA